MPININWLIGWLVGRLVGFHEFNTAYSMRIPLDGTVYGLVVSVQVGMMKVGRRTMMVLLLGFFHSLHSLNFEDVRIDSEYPNLEYNGSLRRKDLLQFEEPVFF